MADRVPFGKDLPPPLVPLPSCHARVKQLQARLFNGVPVLSSFVANCRLCMGSNFGEKSTTIVEERFCTMLKHVFPFPITNQTGLPVNVCDDCDKAVQMFYGYSHHVQANQLKLKTELKLLDTLRKAEYLDYTEANNVYRERAQHPDAHRVEIGSSLAEKQLAMGKESQKNDEGKISIDANAQCHTEANETDQSEDPLLQQPHYEGTPLRSAVKVRTVSTCEKTIGHLMRRDENIFVDCKPNVNENEAESPALKLIHCRKKARLSFEESGPEPLEQSATDQGKPLGPKTLYICSICNQTFDKHHTLICHQKTHLMRGCPICNKSFQFSLLAKHIIQEHTGEKSKI